MYYIISNKESGKRYETLDNDQCRRVNSEEKKNHIKLMSAPVLGLASFQTTAQNPAVLLS